MVYDHISTHYISYVMTSLRVMLAVKLSVAIIFFLVLKAVEPVRDDLYDAVYVADVEAVKSLVDIDPRILRPGRLDIDVNRTDGSQRTSLMMCGYDPQTENSMIIDKKCRKISKILFEKNMNIFYVDPLGWDALHMAAVRGLTKFCKYLIEQGVDMNRSDEDGRTSLMKAAGHGHFNTTAMLIKLGANTSLVDNAGQTVLHYATNLACGNESYLPGLERLLPYLAEVDNPRDTEGRTALMHAVIGGGTLKVISTLLAHGANPRLHDDYGVSVLAMSRNRETTELLAEHMARQVELDHDEWSKSQTEL